MSDVTLKDVARAIGWLDAMNEDIDFDSANWSTVEDNGEVVLEGYADVDGERHYIRATATLRLDDLSLDPEDEDYGDDDDD